jgi:hypothetical protein
MALLPRLRHREGTYAPEETRTSVDLVLEAITDLHEVEGSCDL